MDGKCCSGKSSLADLLKNRYDLVLRGFYEVNIYINEKIGLFIEIENIEDYDLEPYERVYESRPDALAAEQTSAETCNVCLSQRPLLPQQDAADGRSARGYTEY